MSRCRSTGRREGSRAQPGETLLVAGPLADEVAATPASRRYSVIARFPGVGSGRHGGAPSAGGQGYEFDVPLLAATFVEADQGTGLVHIAPGHGADDFELGRGNGCRSPTRSGRRAFTCRGCRCSPAAHVYRPDGKPGDANEAVIAAIDAAGGLLARGVSGSLLSAFVAVEGAADLPQHAAMVHQHGGQWVAREGAGGDRRDPLGPGAGAQPHRGDGREQARLVRVAAARLGCADRRSSPIATPASRCAIPPSSSASPPRSSKRARMSGSAPTPRGFSAMPTTRQNGRKSPISSRYGSNSGSTHAFVLEERPELRWPASLYLEGSDQHRGWFHSSLLEACGTRGRAPYEAVLTHGFVLDEQGRKMSKSLGNVVAPQEVMQQSGADILRLWVVGSDYSEDLRIGPRSLSIRAMFIADCGTLCAISWGRSRGSNRARQSASR